MGWLDFMAVMAFCLVCDRRSCFILNMGVLWNENMCDDIILAILVDYTQFKT